MRGPLRLAILECDTPLPNTRQKLGDYGTIFENLLKRGMREMRSQDMECRFEITKWTVEEFPEYYPNVEDIDAILITGSRCDSFADEYWINKLVDFTGHVLANNSVRVIGVCFGHQIIARAMGMRVQRNELGWEAGVTQVGLTRRGREVFKKSNLNIHQMHRDLVFQCPDGVELLGFSRACKVQGMYIEGDLITLQGHPEFDREIMEEVIEHLHQEGIFDEEACETYLKRAALEHDGVAISQAFLRLLTGITSEKDSR